MKLDTSFLSRLALIGLLSAGSLGCDGAEPAAAVTDAGAGPKPPAVSPNAPEPTEERLVERVRAMWVKKTAGQWVEVYDFIAPPVRKVMPISQFLAGKEYHTYANPVLHEVMKLDPNGAWVRVSTLWTPTHPQVQKALGPGESATQDVESVETWRWTDGDWYYVEAKSIEEFVEQNPDVLKKKPAGGESQAAAATPAPGADAEDEKPK